MADPLTEAYHKKLIAKGFSVIDNICYPPIGMDGLAVEDIKNQCWQAAQAELEPQPPSGPFWHDQNPWNDHIVYVPIEELAQCMFAVGKGIRMEDGSISICTAEGVIRTWRHFGEMLDAYILTGPVLTAGVRFGAEGDQYLSPGFSLPKLAVLLQKYRTKIRRSA